MNNPAILLVLNLQNSYSDNLKEEINEMILLANTLQYQIIETIIQKKSSIDSSTYFGKGKILQVINQAKELNCQYIFIQIQYCSIRFNMLSIRFNICSI